MDMDDIFSNLERGQSKEWPAWKRMLVGIGGSLLVIVALILVLVLTLPSLFASAAETVQIVNKPVKDTFDFTIESEVDEVSDPLDKLSAYDGKPVTIVLLGTDTRGEMSRQSALEGDSSDMRSDVMISLTLTADRKHLVVTSTMRDLWVYSPKIGEYAKLNDAFRAGGIPYALEMISAQTGQPAAHVAAVDFGGFKKSVDLLGGVTVDNEIAFTGSHLDHFYPQGVQTLNGEEALAYARERYAFPNADYQRTENQRRLLMSVAQTLMSSGKQETLSSLLSMRDYVTTDAGMSTDFLVGFYEAMEANDTEIVQVLYPTAGTGTESNSMISGQSVVYVDETRAAQFRAALADGTISEYIAANEGVNW